jgi:hypothetical protein
VSGWARRIEQGFQLGDQLLRMLADLKRELARRGQEIRIVHDARHESLRTRVVRGDETRVEEKLQRARLADSERQQCERRRVGKDAEPEERRAERGALSGNPDVARERDVEAASAARAIHRRNRDLRERADRARERELSVEDSREARRVPGFAIRPKLLEIASRAERPPRAGDDDGAHARIRAQALDRREQFLTRLLRERVQPFGSIEAQSRERSIDLEQNARRRRLAGRRARSAARARATVAAHLRLIQTLFD